MVVFATIAFLYFARPVLLPIGLACIAGVTLKPLIGWLSRYHIPKALSAAVVLGVLIATIVIGFMQLGRPALRWVDDAPQHMVELRQRVQKLIPRIGSLNEAATAMVDLGATAEEKKAEQKKAPTVEVKVSNGGSSILNWTGTLPRGHRRDPGAALPVAGLRRSVHAKTRSRDAHLARQEARRGDQP